MLTENTDSGGPTRSVLLALQPTTVPRSERRRFESLAVLVMVTTPERLVERIGTELSAWKILVSEGREYVQGLAKRSADFVKQQPGRTRQNS